MLEHLLRFATVLSIAIAALAIYITVHHNRLQLGAQIFLAYSDRVRMIRLSGATDKGMDPEAVAAALFLIFEFYELKRWRFLPKTVWKILDRDIADLLRTEHFQAEWNRVRRRFRNHPHFLSWVEAQLEYAGASTEAGL